MSLIANPKIIVALDYYNQADAMRMVEQLNPEICRVKVGKELFTACGPKLIEELRRKGFDVFLDLKFHDIPQTVANAINVAADLDVWMVNVHVLGGRQMLEAARNVLDARHSNVPLLIGVTLLTSLSSQDLPDICIDKSLNTVVQQLARLAYQSGLDGIVCSAQDIEGLKPKINGEFLYVTPGIRLDDHISNDDQKRIMTPSQAVKSGSDYLVIGRPITKSSNPASVLSAIEKEIAHIL